MATLAEQMGDHVANILLNTDHSAVSVLYQPPDGGSVTQLTAIVDESAGAENETDEFGRRIQRRAIVTLAAADTVEVGLAIDPKGSFLIESETWQIVGPGARDADLLDFECVLVDQKQKRKTRSHL